MDLAARMKDALKERGFSVFMDIEDLKSGKFNEALLQKIEEATDFLVILTPGCLERCQDEEDWLRKEIRHAIASKRNIVPILARGFQMPPPQALPADLLGLPNYNGLAPAPDLFEASIDRLVSVFLKAGRSGHEAIEQLLREEKSARSNLNMARQQLAIFSQEQENHPERFMQDQIEIFEDDVRKYELRIKEIRSKLRNLQA